MPDSGLPVSAADGGATSELNDDLVRTVLACSPALTMVFDEDGTVIYVNNGLTRLFPVTSDLVGLSFNDLSPPFPLDFTYRIEDLLERPVRERFETPVEGTEGERWLDVSVTPDLRGDRVAGLILLALDDTARRRLLTSLSHRATHDPLTGLANRSLLLTNLSFQLAMGQPDRLAAAVMFIDLDRFKQINDSLGHEAGDQLLLQTAARVVDTVRGTDTVARLGGDEFVVMLEGPLTKETVEVLADRLHKQFNEPFRVGDQEVYVSVSIGVSYPTHRSQTAEDLLRRADAAMYVAKERGRDRFQLFDFDLEMATQERLEIESALRAADSDEFSLHFQPEIELATGKLVGVEALLRWNHPTDGWVDAEGFIEIAEETGVIIELGGWVIDEACRTLGEWTSHPDSEDLTLRVNLSARQLSHPGCLEDIRSRLDATGIDPGRLCFELAERSLMDAERSLTVLNEMRELGVRLAIDDFGTGHSSLVYLKRFPIDVLKIDRRFVAGVPSDPDDLAIVRSIVGLAEAFGLELVAEGVEREAQAGELRRLGVHRGQGWLFGRPVDQESFERLAGMPATPASTVEPDF